MNPKKLQSQGGNKKMVPRYKSFISRLLVIFALLFTLLTASQAETIRYLYDDQNRVIQIRYEDGTIIDYIYDEVGNRAQLSVTAPNANGRSRIGTTPYGTLQDAYDAAANGTTIKCQAIRFVENLTVNRNISVTLEGGYDASYTSNSGNTSTLQGMISTTVGGGTITIKNFIIQR
jgi:YD repeat-containing protein